MPPTDPQSNPASAAAGEEAAQSLQTRPREQLLALARGLGLAVEDEESVSCLAQRIARRREVLGRLDRKAMLSVARWGRRTVTEQAGKEELARHIAQITRNHFGGLTREGLFALASLRGLEVSPDADAPTLIRAMRSRQGLLEKFHRKRRKIFGSMVAKLIGEKDAPPPEAADLKRGVSIKQTIEEQGIIAGLAGRIRGAADDYIAAKLDEIETRIDSKLDQIDHRLSEWRDREIATRLRIIKITLAASVAVALLSLLMAWLSRRLF